MQSKFFRSMGNLAQEQHAALAASAINDGSVIFNPADADSAERLSMLEQA